MTWLRQGVAVLLIAATGCGTILYPERRGQRAGELDPGVVLLDALGLLVFFVPGVIAFAVDFSTGAIYLPRGQRSKILDLERRSLREHPRDAIEAALREHAGVEVDLHSPAVQVVRVDSLADAEVWLMAERAARAR
jgi:hypothetical protein